MSHPLETYLRDVRQIHSSGAAMAETSYYNALGNLLNVVGDELNPKVRCILQLKNAGAGIPDGGLFTQDQLRKAPDSAPMLNLLPGRVRLRSSRRLRSCWRSHAASRWPDTSRRTGRYW